jgi:two-component system alkaline phosphatase synthesis response regulator PhoP
MPNALISTEVVVLLVGQHGELQSWLQQAGFCVLTAATGEEALELSERFVDDLALIADLDLGVMTGVELCSRIRAQRPQTPVLLIAGQTQEVLVPDVQVLRKPLLPWEFLDKVGSLLRGRSA